MAAELLGRVNDACGHYTQAFDTWLAAGADAEAEELTAVGAALDNLVQAVTDAIVEADD